MPLQDQCPAGCLDRRRAGVLLHLTSLPGAGPAGDLGWEACNFASFLRDTGISVWQMLPVNPPNDVGSPYQSSSVHAGNPQLIGIEPLIRAGWLEAWSTDRLSAASKLAALRQSQQTFAAHARAEDKAALERFTTDNAYWLDDYALFRAIREEQGAPWWDWPASLRDRKPAALKQAYQRLAAEIDYIAYEQFLFFSQWSDLRVHCQGCGVKLFGDLPIFVAHDSAEVWADPEDFLLDEKGMPTAVAGVPPDYFSETGQRWGNPLYDWNRLQANGFRFWINRIRTQLRLFDMVRIDHFRGLEAYWEIPADEDSAINGKWVKAPGDALLKTLRETFADLPLVAEDLGTLTAEVEQLRKAWSIPGMKVLQFAFDQDLNNPYRPYRHDCDSVVYTGTHDNDTTVGWFNSLPDWEKGYVYEYLNQSSDAMPWPLIKSAMASRSQLAVLPMQDLLGLDSSHRMNTPGVSDGNWRWRFNWDQVYEGLPRRMRRIIEIYGRLVEPV